MFVSHLKRWVSYPEIYLPDGRSRHYSEEISERLYVSIQVVPRK
jgi:hypothetical protein